MRPIDKSIGLEQQQTAVLQSFYQMVKGSCGLVTEAFAESCEISGVNSSVNANNRGDRDLMITVSGQIQMTVKMKSDLANP